MKRNQLIFIEKNKIKSQNGKYCWSVQKILFPKFKDALYYTLNIIYKYRVT